MLNELLSVHLFQDIAARYIGNANVPVSGMRLATSVFNCTTGRFDNFTPGQAALRDNRWGNAEGFLERLDIAAHNAKSAATGRLARTLYELVKAEGNMSALDWSAVYVDSRYPTEMKSTIIDELRGYARRLVALQCRIFTDDADTSDESWGPYVSWADKIRGSHEHSIVEFNYDNVPEKLNLRVLLPSQIGTQDDAKLSVLKLHGSVNWRRLGLGEECSLVHPDPKDWSLETCAASEIAVAMPGPSKKADSKGPLEPLWRAAKGVLSNAESIVIIGYRFPPSDSHALTELLSAIQANASTLLLVHIVLGPDLHHPDVVRMNALVRYTLENAKRRDVTSGYSTGECYGVMIHPLWAQDFLALWSPELTARFY